MANNQYNFLDYAGLSLFWNNVKSIIEENELATASALTNLDTRVDNLEASKSDKGHTHNFGEITPGVATIGDGANRLMFRTNSNYKNGIYYSTPGNEALVFGTITPITSWIFATTDPTTQTAWTSLTPSLQIKNGRVTINKLIANNTDASYNLDVNGSANATTLYENGVRVSVDGHTHTKSQITDFAHTHTKSQITDFPTSLPASDVKAWAKADNKPSYTGTEVTLSGYSKNNSYTPIASGDSVQAAIAKLEGAINGLEDLLASI